MIRHTPQGRWLLLVMVWSFVLAFTRTPAAQDSQPEASARAEPSRPPLQPLPQAPAVELKPATPEQLEQLKAVLDRLRSPDATTRTQAANEIRQTDPSLVSAAAALTDRIADDSDKEAMKRLLHDLRKEAREKIRERLRAQGSKDKVVTPDYLDLLVEYARPDLRDWQDLISIVGVSRALVAMNSIEAAREVVRIYVRFGEFLRADTQLQIKALGPRGTAALVEATRFPAAKIASWAKRRLEFTGQDNASEVVQTDDYEALADLLRAYGRMGDPENARLLLSFANSERSGVRLAARQAITMLGESAHWQLRDNYENIVGRSSPREWSWDRTARELFAELDRARLSEVYSLFDQGRAAFQAGDLANMRQAYDRLLARSPRFEQRGQLVDGYLALAKSLLDEKPDEAASALHRVVRLSDEESIQNQAKSLLLTIEADALLAQGIADQVLYRRALQLDESNARAREKLDEIERQFGDAESRFQRYVGAAVIGLAALLGGLYFVFRRRNASAAN